MPSSDLSLVQISQMSESKRQLDVSELIVAYLNQLGIDVIFGVPGGAIEPIYNAISRGLVANGPRPVVARHEAGSAFMADGYARETGKLGVCIATSGPGATNLITGVACAYDNDIPMLVITGQPALPMFGKRALQESSCTGVNTLAMFEQCTHYNTLVSHPDQLEPKLIAALMRAMRTPRGPVHLSIPLDILKSVTKVSAPTHDLRKFMSPRTLVDESALAQLIDEVNVASNVVMLIGGGCGEAARAMMAFAQAQGVCVITSPDGKGLVDPHHPLMHGVYGFAGHMSADALLREPDVDLVLAAGVSMSEWTSAGWSNALLNDRLIHIDAVEEHMTRSPMARLHVHGNMRLVFERLLQSVKPGSTHLRSVDHVASERLGRGAIQMAQEEKLLSDQAPIAPQRLMYELGRLCPPNTRFLTDAGNSSAWAIHYLQPQHHTRTQSAASSAAQSDDVQLTNRGGWLRVTMDFAPMGWAIGGAVGTAVGNPGAPVVCMTGDGSMLMNGQEISTAVAERLPMLFVVLNDAALGMVKHGQRLAGAERIAYEIPVTDFAAMARAMGAQAFSVRSPAELCALDFDAIFRHAGPTLLDVTIDGEEVPPMNLRMKVLGSAS